MSFGTAATGRSAKDGDSCPCGSGRTHGGCCGPILRGSPAPTAEALMRSRYAAFAARDARHLLATWHPRTRPDDLELDPALVWTRLEILGTDAGGEDDDTGVVEFRAHWRRGRETGTLHERSSFSRVRGRWVYVDGVVS